MSYRAVKYRLKRSIETELHYAGRYGRKGEKRAPKEKASPEQIQKQNKWKKTNHVRRLIALNFDSNDLFCTLKYPKGTRKPIEEVQRDMRNYINRLRPQYAKLEIPLKYIYRIELGRRGGIHIHMIIKNPGKGKLLQEKWTAGRINFQYLYDHGGYADLADYMTKDLPEDTEGQMSMFGEGEKKKLLSYHPSRNLDKPVPEVKEYRNRTVRKIIQEGPVPEAGYYIDKNSIRQGINKYTGMSYLYYTEYKLGQVPWEVP